MQISRRRACRALVSAASALVIGLAVQGTPSQARAADIEEITWALPGFPDTLLVAHAWSTYEGAIMSLVQEGLLVFGDDLSLQPGIADTWSQTDPQTYVYHIRDGITFHDGSPVTADDVVFSMTWHQDPNNRSQLGAFFASVASIEATGPQEVTVKLKKPDAQFQYSPAHMAGFIMKKSQLEAAGADYGTPAALPLGTGPYKLVEWVPGDRVVMEAYDGYWGGRPSVRRIVMQPIPDTQTRQLAMRNGDIDGTFDVPISEVDQWQQLDGVDVATASSLGVYQVTLDFGTPPFDDIHIRKAIAHALDKQGLVTAILKGKGEAAVAINPPGMWAGVLDEAAAREFYATLPQLEFDLEKAKAELAQSSMPNGFEFTIPVPNTEPLMLYAMLSLAENLKQIGVTMNVSEVDYSAWLDTYFAHENMGAQIISYFPDYADAANYPFLFYHSLNAGKDGMNGSTYKNPAVDAALDKALQSSDPAERAAALKEAITLANADVATIPIFWPDSAMAIRSDYALKGYSAFWYNIPWAIRGLAAK